VEAVVWSDYLCPWCYLGRDRTTLLEHLGVAVTPLPYDLHPELPAAGRRVSPTARLAEVLARIGAECAAVGLPFTPPEHIPNTRLAQRAAEIVRADDIDAFARLDAALFAAVFVDGVDIGDPAQLAEIVTASGADGATVVQSAQAGEGADAVRASMDAAHEVGVTGTPAWLLDGKLLIPGVQDRSTIEQWVSRMIARSTSG
jgi:predicted DsbA family dithiol-disulfide isomerase